LFSSTVDATEEVQSGAPRVAQDAAPIIDFLDARSAFASKSTVELLLSWSIYKACGIKAIVDNAETLYSLAIRVFGSTLVHAIVRRSMFKHFCAGEDVPGIAPRVESLRKLGVGSILDYAAEAELEASNAAKKTPESAPSQESMITARVYEYSSEEEADGNTKVFETAVHAVKDTSPEGFAAIKISALGDPQLLERISTSLMELRSFFHRMRSLRESNLPEYEWSDDLRDLTYDEFRAGWQKFFTGDEDVIRAEFDRMDTKKNGTIDYIEWTYGLSPSQLSSLVKTCKEEGSLSRSALNEEELILFDNMQSRVDRICALAQRLGVRVMLDAEWVAVQPAIDYLALAMQRKYNQERPIVFNTYQAYLTRALADCRIDMARSRQEGWCFGAKVVRGAYMVAERERAKVLGIPSPVWNTYEESEKSFHSVVEEVLDYIAEGEQGVAPGAAMMVASHNRHSVALTVNKMSTLGLKPDTGVYFGQLLGMADHVTMTLGRLGYKAYKYVPYGPVDKVMPYLIRRTQENSTFLGSPGVQEERALVSKELRRRLLRF